jgi:hypothetical protein
MITFLEYYKLTEAPTTYQDRRQGEVNSAEIQNPPPAPVPPGPSDPTAQQADTAMGNDRAIQGGAMDPQVQPPVAQPITPPEPVDLQTAGDRYLGELQDLMASGLQGEELRAAWNDLYNRINTDTEEVGAANDEINAAAAENPMDAVGVPDDDRYRGLQRARTGAIRAGREQGIVDSKQIRKLKDGNLILIG